MTPSITQKMQLSITGEKTFSITLFFVLFMLSVEFKAVMLSVVLPNVIKLSVIMTNGTAASNFS